MKNGDKPRAWQRMLSGRRLDLLDPSPLDIEIEDIAHGLARVARWNGQTSGDHAFSVAQHALLVDAIAGILNAELSARDRLAILLHDAPEYVIGDMISPFKAVMGGEYKPVEERLLGAVFRRYGLPLPNARLLKVLKTADRAAAYYESTRLAGFAESEAAKFFGRPNGINPEKLELDPWTAVEAEARFLRRFGELSSAVGATP
jgi:5'-deoxynucleotidase YfbR-like HD superfamily hydrolase